MEFIELCLVLIFAVALIGATAKRVPIPLPLFVIERELDFLEAGLSAPVEATELNR